jgi:hypothetical protein
MSYSDSPFEPKPSGLSKNYGPFCDNPRCELHKKQVPEGLNFLNTVPPMQFKTKAVTELPLTASIKYEQVHRYQVGTTVKGLTIRGKLCETCMEVLRMFEGWP